MAHRCAQLRSFATTPLFSRARIRRSTSRSSCTGLTVAALRALCCRFSRPASSAACSSSGGGVAVIITPARPPAVSPCCSFGILLFTTGKLAKGKQPPKRQFLNSLKASTIIGMAQHHYHEVFPSTFSNPPLWDVCSSGQDLRVTMQSRNHPPCLSRLRNGVRRTTSWYLFVVPS